ncbi:hypothetical protein DMENIID0001_004990 [Sergentomyia squamirostris]
MASHPDALMDQNNKDTDLTYNCHTSNQFSMFNSNSSLGLEHEHMGKNSRSTGAIPKAPSKVNETHTRPAPITATNIDYSNLSQLLTEAKIPHQLEMMKIGIKIFIETKEIYPTVVQFLQEKGIQFFSYQLSEEKLLKFVVTGLFKMPKNELLEHLKQVNVDPVDVKEMNLQRKNFDNQANYILFFKKGSITLDQLKKVRAVNNIIVGWQDFSRQGTSEKPVLQCSRCQMYGHLTRYCSRKLICAKCGAEHETDHCMDTTGTIKCSNCNGNHDSRDTTCPKRREYVDLRERGFRNQANNHQNKRNTIAGTRATPTLNLGSTKEYPALKTPAQDYLRAFQETLRTQQTSSTSETTLTTARLPTAQTPVQPVQAPGLYSSVVASTSHVINSAHIQPTVATTTTEGASSQNAHNNELFTYEEIMVVKEEVINELAKCTTKSQQFFTITRLAAKFHYSSR